MRTDIRFILDGRQVVVDFSGGSPLRPTTTLLEYLRSLPAHRGAKEGCAEGDCGACTVVLAEPRGEGTLTYRAVDSCLLFLPMIDGRQVITVENLRSPSGALHPVQEAMVRCHASQCGYCTPGIVMSLFALYKAGSSPARAAIEDALAGNLCRCTGYLPIFRAAEEACALGPIDHFSDGESAMAAALASLAGGGIAVRTPGATYVRPASLEEAFRAMEECPRAVIVGGGTDAALRVTKKHESLAAVIDIGAVAELREVRREHAGLRLGAGIPLADIPAIFGGSLPALADALSVFGSGQVRNCATLGGNLGTASPIGDAAPVLMACGAAVLLRSRGGARSVALDDFFTGYRTTARRPEELICAVEVPPPDGSLLRFYKVSRRRDLDIATLSAGFRLRLNRGGIVESVTLAYGGMADRTKRARCAEAFLIGGPWSRVRVEEAADLLAEDFAPITDVRGSAEFRMQAAKNLLFKFWLESGD